jgi:hypothetical protein
LALNPTSRIPIQASDSNELSSDVLTHMAQRIGRVGLHMHVAHGTWHMGATWEIKKDKEGWLTSRASGKKGGPAAGEPVHFENGFDSNSVRLIKFRNSKKGKK